MKPEQDTPPLSEYPILKTDLGGELAGAAIKTRSHIIIILDEDLKYEERKKALEIIYSDIHKFEGF